MWVDALLFLAAGLAVFYIVPFAFEYGVSTHMIALAVIGAVLEWSLSLLPKKKARVRKKQRR